MNSTHSLLYQTMSWGRPHTLDPSLTVPYILSLQAYSSYQANPPRGKKSTQHQSLTQHLLWHAMFVCWRTCTY